MKIRLMGIELFDVDGRTGVRANIRFSQFCVRAWKLQEEIFIYLKILRT